MQPLVREIFEGLTNAEIMTISLRSGVGFMTIKAWVKDRRTPRVDLLIACAEAAGATLTLNWPEGSRKMKRKPASRNAGQLRIINAPGGKIEAWQDGKVIGYVQDDILFGIDTSGYAVEVGSVSHRVEISAKLGAWRAKNGKPSAVA